MATPVNPDGKVLPIERFPPELRRALRILAAVESSTMRQEVIDAVMMWSLADPSVRAATRTSRDNLRLRLLAAYPSDQATSR